MIDISLIDIPIDFFFKCLISLFLGGIIGYERSIRKKPAGIKTHALICLGATIITFLSFHFSQYGDPSRIAAQIVSGIGFIGAGTIFVSKQQVQGLTSAATVWVCAAIGMLIGANHIVLALIAVATILALFYLVHPKFTTDTYLFTMRLDILNDRALHDISKLISKFNIMILSKSLEKDKELQLKLNYRASNLMHYMFVKRLSKHHGIGKVYSI